MQLATALARPDLYPWEVPLISDRDLQILQSFNGHGNITLSAYLCLNTPEHGESVYEDFMQQMQARLDECGSSQECREALREDMDIVGLYLRSNGHHHQGTLAIFCCAAELFWRVYPLPLTLPTQVWVGPKFNIEPLNPSTAEPAPGPRIS